MKKHVPLDDMNLDCQLIKDKVQSIIWCSLDSKCKSVNFRQYLKCGFPFPSKVILKLLNNNDDASILKVRIGDFKFLPFFAKIGWADEKWNGICPFCSY